jgi:hypothetical protein
VQRASKVNGRKRTSVHRTEKINYACPAHLFAVHKKLTVEDIPSDELKRERNLDTFAVVDDWDSVVHSVCQMPIEHAAYTNRVSDRRILKEMIDTLEASDFDNVKRSESRKKRLAQFTRTLSMYYNLVFTKGKKKVSYGALLPFPKLGANPDRSGGLVLPPRLWSMGRSATPPSREASSTASLSRSNPTLASWVTSNIRLARCRPR